MTPPFELCALTRNANQACEASWHSGHTLADTLLTCLYVQSPGALSPAAAPVAAALVCSCRASAAASVALALAADIYEEEDFVPHTFGMPWLAAPPGEGEAAEVAGACDAAAAWLVSAPVGDAALEGLTRELANALGAHCVLRGARLRVDAAACRLTSETLRDPPAATKLLKLLDALDGALKAVAALPPLTPEAAASSSSSSSAAAPAPADAPPPPPARAPSRPGFDPAVGRRLLGGALPRTTQAASLPASLDAASRHSAQLRCVATFAASWPGHAPPPLHALVEFLDAFGRGEAPPPPPGAAPSTPGTLARSAALCALLPDEAALGDAAAADAAGALGVALEWAPRAQQPPIDAAAAAAAAPTIAAEPSPAATADEAAAADALVSVSSAAAASASAAASPPAPLPLPPGIVGAGCTPCGVSHSFGASHPSAVGVFFASAGRAADGLLRCLACSRPRARRRLRHAIAEWAPLVAAGEALQHAGGGGGDGDGGATEQTERTEQGERGEAAPTENGSLSSPPTTTPTAMTTTTGGGASAAQPEPPARVWARGVAGDDAAASRWGERCLSGWALGWMCSVQSAHLESGLSLELYPTASEMAPLFWYLEYLAACAAEQARMSEEAVASAGTGAALREAAAANDAAAAAKAAVAAAGGGSDRKARRAAEAAAGVRARSALARLHAASAPAPASPRLRRLMATQALCAGCCRLCSALCCEPGGGGAPSSAFNDAHHRFWLRYGTLHNYASPSPLHCEQWETFLAGCVSAPRGQLLRAAEAYFATASSQFKQLLPGCSGQARLAGGNAVALSMARERPGEVATSFGVGHRGWPALKATRTAAAAAATDSPKK